MKESKDGKGCRGETEEIAVFQGVEGFEEERGWLKRNMIFKFFINDLPPKMWTHS